MITQLSIKNFKAIRNETFELKNINVFTGLNGMGKSSVLQTLLLLRQSKDSIYNSLKLNGNLISIGTFIDAYCESAPERGNIEFELSFSDDDKLYLSSEYSVAASKESVLPILNSVVLQNEQVLFSSNQFTYLNAHRIGTQDGYATDKTSIDQKQLGNQGQYAPHYFHIHKHKEIAIKQLAYDEDDEIFTLEHQLNKWLGVISPQVQVHTEINQDLISLLYSYKTALGKTNFYKAKNAGFGLTYVFSVLTAILSAKPGDILLLENPESHIHPRGQSELGRLLALAAENGVQLFVETHSDHILYGLRIAVKERDLSKDKLKIYYLQRDENEPFSTAFDIQIDEHGRMERSARKYFNEFEGHLDKLMG